MIHADLDHERTGWETAMEYLVTAGLVIVFLLAARSVAKGGEG